MPDDDSAVAVPGHDGADESGATAPDDRLPGDEPPIEPQRPAMENVVFVLLGVLVALATVFRLVQLFG